MGTTPFFAKGGTLYRGQAHSACDTDVVDFSANLVTIAELGHLRHHPTAVEPADRLLHAPQWAKLSKRLGHPEVRR